MAGGKVKPSSNASSWGDRGVVSQRTLKNQRAAKRKRDLRRKHEGTRLVYMSRENREKLFGTMSRENREKLFKASERAHKQEQQARQTRKQVKREAVMKARQRDRKTTHVKIKDGVMNHKRPSAREEAERYREAVKAEQKAMEEVFKAAPKSEVLRQQETVCEADEAVQRLYEAMKKTEVLEQQEREANEEKLGAETGKTVKETAFKMFHEWEDKTRTKRTELYEWVKVAMERTRLAATKRPQYLRIASTVSSTDVEAKQKFEAALGLKNLERKAVREACDAEFQKRPRGKDAADRANKGLAESKQELEAAELTVGQLERQVKDLGGKGAQKLTELENAAANSWSAFRKRQLEYETQQKAAELEAAELTVRQLEKFFDKKKNLKEKGKSREKQQKKTELEAARRLKHQKNVELLK